MPSDLIRGSGQAPNPDLYIVVIVRLDRTIQKKELDSPIKSWNDGGGSGNDRGGRAMTQIRKQFIPVPRAQGVLAYSLTQKMQSAGAWMAEKYFAATPFTCRNTIFNLRIIILSAIVNCITEYWKILLKSKDFEGIRAPANIIQIHFWG